MNNILKDFNPYYDDFLKELQELLRIRSILTEYDKNNKEYPFGKGVRESLDYMINLSKKDGFMNVTNDDNYGGFFEYGSGEEIVLILSHLDVVPVNEKEWTNPPFEPIIKGNRLYARGSSDDKGPLMACYYALKMLKDEGYQPKRKVRFYFGCDEESGSRCLEHFKEKYDRCDYGFSPDADFPLIYAEKGISNFNLSGEFSDKRVVKVDAGIASNIVIDKASVTLKDIDLKDEFIEYAKSNNFKYEIDDNTYILYGKACHGSTPEEGINALTHIAHFMSKHLFEPIFMILDKYFNEDYVGLNLGIKTVDDEMGEVSLNPGVMRSNGNKYNLVVNMRYPKNFKFNEETEKMKKLFDGYDVNFEVFHNSNYHYVSKDSFLVKSLMSSFNKYKDIAHEKLTEPFSIGGGTYARDFKNAVAFGAMFSNEENTMHMSDEYKEIDKLILSVYIYKDAIKALCD